MEKVFREAVPRIERVVRQQGGVKRFVPVFEQAWEIVNRVHEHDQTNMSLSSVMDSVVEWAKDGVREFGTGYEARQLLLELNDEECESLDFARKCRISYSARQCRNLLANALLNNLNDTAVSGNGKRVAAGGLKFLSMLNLDSVAGPDKVGVQKLAALLNYFRHWKVEGEGCADLDRLVHFEVLRSTEDDAAFEKRLMEACNISIDFARIKIHGSTMEEVMTPNSAFVNFANARFAYGAIIPSCTQEEILLEMCPEHYVGMIHIGKMDRRTVAIVHNVRRFSTYKGYSHTFELTGSWKNTETAISPIVVMDASIGRSQGKAQFIRDIRKAFVGFSALGGSRTHISSGKWGCGVFGGDPHVSLVKQIIASTLAGKSLSFALFGDRNASSYEKFIHTIRTQASDGDDLAIQQLWSWMIANMQ